MDSKAIEILAGPRELAAIYPEPLRVAVCDDETSALLAAAWPGTQLVANAHRRWRQTCSAWEKRG
ncbi:MAG: hypothetical protein WDM87_00735 [Terracidiphilus sp.]